MTNLCTCDKAASPREEPRWSGPETTLTKGEAALIERLTQLVKRFPSDQGPDDTPVDGFLTVKQACDAREALRNLSRERYWRRWEKGVEALSLPVPAAGQRETPTVWRVKDFADGWIYFDGDHAQERAEREAFATGATLEALTRVS